MKPAAQYFLKKSSFVIALIAALTLSACVDLLNATIPSDGYTVEHNIAYGDKAR